MKYSVIIPAYNVGKYITEAIESVVSQDYNDLELIIVNDGSSDGTERICLEYVKKFSWIKLISKENGGVSSARNVGIDAALGKYLYFLDGDDVLLKGLFNAIDLKPEADIYFSTHMFTHDMTNGKDTDKIVIDIKKMSTLTVRELEKEIILCNGSSCASVWSSKIIKENKIYFDEKIHIGEDDYWQDSVLAFCDKIELIERPYFVYNLHRTNSATTAANMEKLLSGMQPYARLIRKYEAYDGYKKAELLRRFAGSYWNLTRKCFTPSLKKSDAAYLSAKANKYTLKYTNCKVDRLIRVMVAFFGLKWGIVATNIIVKIF